jgi:hypothetical protein
VCRYNYAVFDAAVKHVASHFPGLRKPANNRMRHGM